MPYPTKKLWNIIIENQKSKIKVRDASSEWKYIFFTSWLRTLFFNEKLCEWENLFLATWGKAIIQYYNWEASYSTDTYTLKWNKDTDTRFLYFYLYSIISFIDSHLFSWAWIKHLQKKDFKNILIPLPPLPTQKLIVQKLDSSFEKIDKSIELIKKNLENIEELNKSVLEEVFRELNYSKIKLSDIATIVWWWTPKTNISEYWSNDIIWLSPTDLPAIWEIVNISNSQKKISKLWLEKSSAKLLPIWTVIYSSRATIWKIAINDIELSTNQGFASFICNDKIYNYYLAYTLKYYTEDIISLSNSTTFKEVNKTNLRNYKIPLPPLPIQKQIVSHLDQVFEKNRVLKESYEKKLKDLEEMKQSLLKEAFEWRLVKD